MNNNMVEKIHADGMYQYYNLANIWRDITIALENNLPLVNFATPPVSTREVAKMNDPTNRAMTPKAASI